MLQIFKKHKEYKEYKSYIIQTMFILNKVNIIINIFYRRKRRR